MTDEFTPKAFEPVDLAPELQRESERNDIIFMRKLDKRWGIKRENVESVLLALNTRLIQYKGQFNTYSVDFLVLQTVEDFRLYVVPLQKFNEKKKPNYDKPVAIERDSKKPIMLVNGFFEYQSKE